MEKFNAMLLFVGTVVLGLILQGFAQDIRLVDSTSRCQGRLELRPVGSNNFGQACDLLAGNTEASVVCRQLGCTAEGATTVDPTTYGFSPRINSYAAFGFSCTGSESSLSQCTTRGAQCNTDNPAFAIAIVCGGETPPTVTLIGGFDRCQGRLEHRPSPTDTFGQACDTQTSPAEAQVVCRQLGCNPNGARRVNPTNYGFSAAINSYRAFGFQCNGNEASLSQCSQGGAVCAADDVDSAIAIECGGSQPEFILLGGSDSCQGLVVQRPTSTSRFGLSCDLDADDNEAKVICRQIGCNPNGARRVSDPTVFGFSSAINSYFGFSHSCDGTEPFLSKCTAQPFTCVTDSAPHAFAIDCGPRS